jgi:hypothetical protein
MAEQSTSTVDGCIDLDAQHGPGVRQRRRFVYRVTSAVLTVLVGLALIDVSGDVAIYGVESETVRAEGGGYELEVHYPTVSRPALASPFQIKVRRPGGFDGDLTIAVELDYLRLWDENGLNPAPTDETTSGELLVWTYPPPEGDLLTIDYDARIEPAAQSGRSGSVALLDADGTPLVRVSFTTRVLP